MRLNKSLLCVLAASLHLIVFVSCRDAPDIQLRRLAPRETGGQNSPATSATTAPKSTKAPRSTTSNSESRTDSTRSVEPSTTSGGESSPSISAAPVETSDGTSDKIYKGGLPVKPQITPGFGVAGVVLILAGLCYGFVGIKIRRLHVFFSTALLTGLAVTVLIIYVVNPPVGRGVEGGYVTAAVMSGIVLGGIATVFPELTEILGCLLGGFCVSMWLLVLREGGLVASVWGRLIIMGTCGVAVFTLFFLKITRSWALIFSFSFSGATAVVMGIDCFSLGGLKEFWVYIWGLNNRLWPLGTNTYPHTRVMVIEIAAVVLLTVVGIMSQIQLWKIVQGRKTLKDTLQQQQQAENEAVDEEAGRRVEETTEVERQKWEAAFQDKSKPESSVEEELSTTEPSKADSESGGDQSPVESEFAERTETGGPHADHMEPTNGRTSSQSLLQQRGEPIASPDVDEITPLSDVVEDLRQNQREHTLTPSHNGSLKRFSQPPTPSPILSRSNSRELIQSQKQVEISYPSQDSLIPDDDSDGSSFATRADSFSFPAVSETPGTSETATPARQEQLSIMDDTDKEVDDSQRGSGLVLPLELELPEGSETNLRDMNDADVEVQMPSLVKPNYSTANNSEASEGDANLSEQSSQIMSLDGTAEPEAAGGSHEAPQEPLPDSQEKAKRLSIPDKGLYSKIVKTYRTSEWTKNLAEADVPDLEDLSNENSLEEAAPLDIEGLQETATIMPATVQKPKHQRSSSRSSDRLSGSNERTTSSGSNKRTTSSGSNKRTTSAPTTAQVSATAPSHRRALRRSSTPFLPTEEVVPEERPLSVGSAEKRHSNPTHSRRSRVPSRNSDVLLNQGTLLGKRKSIIMKRSSFHSIVPSLHGSTSLGSITQSNKSPSPTPNGSSMNLAQLNDDMPLADRRKFIRQSKSQQLAPPQHQTFSRSTSMQQLPQTQDGKMDTWRESLKADEKLQVVSNTADARRAEMLDEHNQVALKERQKAVRGAVRGGVMEERMRQRDMLELHRDAMRKMQASANRHVSVNYNSPFPPS